MSDPYAEALGIAPAKSSAPQFSAADWAAAGAAQKFDGNSTAILRQEAANAKTPAERSAIASTLAYTQAKIAQQGGTASAAANDPYADALGFGASGQSAQPAAAPAVKPFNQNDISSSEGGAGLGLAQVGAHAVTSGLSSLYGLVRGAGALAAGGGLNDVTHEIEDAQQKYTYNPDPNSPGGRLLNSAPLRLLGKATQAIGDKTLEATGSPLLATIADVGTNAAATAGVGKVLGGKLPGKTPLQEIAAPKPRVEPTMEPASLPTPQPTQPLTTGAAPQPVPAGASVKAQPVAPKPTVAETTPEMQQALADADPSDPVTQRHIDADSLPVPVKLTKGQATLDPVAISEEMNGRGKAKPTVSPEFYNEQGKALSANVDAMRDKVAPDLDPQQMTPFALGQKLVDSYKSMDAPIQADIAAKYKALEDANGGQFPIDGKALAENTQAALDKALKAGSVPADLHANLNQFANGRQMTFQDFETMRSDAADAMRNASDGRQRAAAAIVREQLENMPLTPEAAALKPLADQARAAARARFDALEADPAYKAAVNDGVAVGEPSPVADKFVNAYLVNGKYSNLLNMKSHLAADPAAQQAIGAAGVEYLRGAGKVDPKTGTFTQAGYNKAVEALGPKLDAMLGPEVAGIARRVGSTAKLAQAQPRGSFVNNSNTLVGAAGDVGKAVASNFLAVKTAGLSKGVEAAVNIVKSNKAARAATAPGAGVTKLSDLAPPQEP